MSTLELKDLIGLTLSEGWVIASVKSRGEEATGSMHSYGFVAQHSSGKFGFLKVLNPALNLEIEGNDEQLKDLEIRISRGCKPFCVTVRSLQAHNDTLMVDGNCLSLKCPVQLSQNNWKSDIEMRVIVV